MMHVHTKNVEAISAKYDNEKPIYHSHSLNPELSFHVHIFLLFAFLFSRLFIQTLRIMFMKRTDGLPVYLSNNNLHISTTEFLDRTMDMRCFL
jgi:hypothetical protein